MARQTGAGEQGEGEPGSSADEPSTLEILLDNLGRDVIQAAGAPAGLDALVGEPVIYDAGEHSTISRNAVVLAVGVRRMFCHFASASSSRATAEPAREEQLHVACDR